MAGIGYTANRDRLVIDFINTAIKNRFWIYSPDVKKWYTPEEFLEMYDNNKLHLKDNWYEKYKIMNPQKGLAAAQVQAQQLNEKTLAFQKRVIDYYQSK